MIAAETFRGRFQASNHWINSQLRNPLHWLAVLGFGATIFAGLLSHILLYVCLIIFLLATSIPVIIRNKEMLLICLFVAVVCALIPALAPIAILLMVALYIKRIILVLRNWRPIVGGLVVYGLPVVLATVIDTNPGAMDIVSKVIFCLASMVAMHVLLWWQYKWSYDVPTALSLMGIVPLLIVAFVLPFLKLHIGFDAHDISVDTHPLPAIYTHPIASTSDIHGVSTIVDAQAASAIATSNTDYAFLHPGMGSTSTNTMHINGTSAPPGYNVVPEHLQTDPDGIEANNFSHPGGPDPDAPPAPGVHVVREYVRANPIS